MLQLSRFLDKDALVSCKPHLNIRKGEFTKQLRHGNINTSQAIATVVRST